MHWPHEQEVKIQKDICAGLIPNCPVCSTKLGVGEVVYDPARAAGFACVVKCPKCDRSVSCRCDKEPIWQK